MLFRRIFCNLLPAFAFLGLNGLLRDCSQTKYIFLALGMWSVAQW